MRIGFLLLAVLAFASAALAKDYGQPSAITVSPLHDAQVVRGEDGMDHVEYDLLVVSVLPESATLSSIRISNPAGKELARIEGAALAAVTQSLFAHQPISEIPASAAVAAEVKKPRLIILRFPCSTRFVLMCGPDITRIRKEKAPTFDVKDAGRSCFCAANSCRHPVGPARPHPPSG